ncbi:MAG TPA: alpha-ketoglutarate-dependent dioxygenase AlkB [Casimicrobiaceae bacterium]|nr:alpha-ketoglutarate-dependent dioxygenase AlkB [Casimicrobiaceae bacterium]
MQRALFDDAAPLPAGLAYREDFVSADEEQALVEAVRGLPLAPARYREYVAKRRTASFGFSYDFATGRLGAAPPLPAFLHPLRERAAAWAGVPAAEFVQGLVTAYAPGTPIGWHRDVPDFGVVAGVSLAGACRMRFRPYPPARATARQAFDLALAPRSAYLLRDAIRWGWQHAIPEVAALRYSITFRTLRRPAA